MENPTNYTFRILGDITDTKLQYIRITEWLFVLSMVGWCLYLSIYNCRIFPNKFAGKI